MTEQQPSATPAIYPPAAVASPTHVKWVDDSGTQGYVRSRVIQVTEAQEVTRQENIDFAWRHVDAWRQAMIRALTLDAAQLEGIPTLRDALSPSRFRDALAELLGRLSFVGEGQKFIASLSTIVSKALNVTVYDPSSRLKGILAKSIKARRTGREALIQAWLDNYKYYNALIPVDVRARLAADTLDEFINEFLARPFVQALILAMFRNPAEDQGQLFVHPSREARVANLDGCEVVAGDWNDLLFPGHLVSSTTMECFAEMITRHYGDTAGAPLVLTPTVVSELSKDVPPQKQELAHRADIVQMVIRKTLLFNDESDDARAEELVTKHKRIFMPVNYVTGGTDHWLLVEMLQWIVEGTGADDNNTDESVHLRFNVHDTITPPEKQTYADRISAKIENIIDNWEALIASTRTSSGAPRSVVIRTRDDPTDKIKYTLFFQIPTAEQKDSELCGEAVQTIIHRMVDPRVAALMRQKKQRAIVTFEFDPNKCDINDPRLTVRRVKDVLDIVRGGLVERIVESADVRAILGQLRGIARDAALLGTKPFFGDSEVVAVDRSQLSKFMVNEREFPGGYWRLASNGGDGRHLVVHFVDQDTTPLNLDPSVRRRAARYVDTFKRTARRYGEPLVEVDDASDTGTPAHYAGLAQVQQWAVLHARFLEVQRTRDSGTARSTDLDKALDECQTFLANTTSEMVSDGDLLRGETRQAWSSRFVAARVAELWCGETSEQLKSTLDIATQLIAVGSAMADIVDYLLHHGAAARLAFVVAGDGDPIVANGVDALQTGDTTRLELLSNAAREDIAAREREVRAIFRRVVEAFVQFYEEMNLTFFALQHDDMQGDPLHRRMKKSWSTWVDDNSTALQASTDVLVIQANPDVLLSAYTQAFSQAYMGNEATLDTILDLHVPSFGTELRPASIHFAAEKLLRGLGDVGAFLFGQRNPGVVDDDTRVLLIDIREPLQKVSVLARVGELAPRLAKNTTVMLQKTQLSETFLQSINNGGGGGGNNNSATSANVFASVFEQFYENIVLSADERNDLGDEDFHVYYGKVRDMVAEIVEARGAALTILGAGGGSAYERVKRDPRVRSVHHALTALPFMLTNLARIEKAMADQFSTELDQLIDDEDVTKIGYIDALLYEKGDSSPRGQLRLFVQNAHQSVCSEHRWHCWTLLAPEMAYVRHFINANQDIPITSLRMLRLFTEANKIIETALVGAGLFPGRGLYVTHWTPSDKDISKTSRRLLLTSDIPRNAGRALGNVDDDLAAILPPPNTEGLRVLAYKLREAGLSAYAPAQYEAAIRAQATVLSVERSVENHLGFSTTAWWDATEMHITALMPTLATLSTENAMLHTNAHLRVAIYTALNQSLDNRMPLHAPSETHPVYTTIHNFMLRARVDNIRSRDESPPIPQRISAYLQTQHASERPKAYGGSGAVASYAWFKNYLSVAKLPALLDGSYHSETQAYLKNDASTQLLGVYSQSLSFTEPTAGGAGANWADVRVPYFSQSWVGAVPLAKPLTGDVEKELGITYGGGSQINAWKEALLDLLKNTKPSEPHLDLLDPALVRSSVYLSVTKSAPSTRANGRLLESSKMLERLPVERVTQLSEVPLAQGDTLVEKLEVNGNLQALQGHAAALSTLFRTAIPVLREVHETHVANFLPLSMPNPRDRFRVDLREEVATRVTGVRPKQLKPQDVLLGQVGKAADAVVDATQKSTTATAAKPKPPPALRVPGTLDELVERGLRSDSPQSFDVLPWIPTKKDIKQSHLGVSAADLRTLLGLSLDHGYNATVAVTPAHLASPIVTFSNESTRNLITKKRQGRTAIERVNTLSTVRQGVNGRGAFASQDIRVGQRVAVFAGRLHEFRVHHRRDNSEEERARELRSIEDNAPRFPHWYAADYPYIDAGTAQPDDNGTVPRFVVDPLDLPPRESGILGLAHFTNSCQWVDDPNDYEVSETSSSSASSSSSLSSNQNQQPYRRTCNIIPEPYATDLRSIRRVSVTYNADREGDNARTETFGIFFMVATRAIKKGEELLWPYGNAYIREYRRELKFLQNVHQRWADAMQPTSAEPLSLTDVVELQLGNPKPARTPYAEIIIPPLADDATDSNKRRYNELKNQKVQTFFNKRNNFIMTYALRNGLDMDTYMRKRSATAEKESHLVFSADIDPTIVLLHMVLRAPVFAESGKFAPPGARPRLPTLTGDILNAVDIKKTLGVVPGSMVDKWMVRLRTKIEKDARSKKKGPLYIEKQLDLQMRAIPRSPDLQRAGMSYGLLAPVNYVFVGTPLLRKIYEANALRINKTFFYHTLPAVIESVDFERIRSEFSESDDTDAFVRTIYNHYFMRFIENLRTAARKRRAYMNNVPAKDYLFGSTEERVLQIRVSSHMLKIVKPDDDASDRRVRLYQEMFMAFAGALQTAVNLLAEEQGASAEKTADEESKHYEVRLVREHMQDVMVLRPHTAPHYLRHTGELVGAATAYGGPYGKQCLERHDYNLQNIADPKNAGLSLDTLTASQSYKMARRLVGPLQSLTGNPEVRQRTLLLPNSNTFTSTRVQMLPTEQLVVDLWERDGWIGDWRLMRLELADYLVDFRHGRLDPAENFYPTEGMESGRLGRRNWYNEKPQGSLSLRAADTMSGHTWRATDKFLNNPFFLPDLLSGDTRWLRSARYTGEGETKPFVLAAFDLESRPANTPVPAPPTIPPPTPAPTVRTRDVDPSGSETTQKSQATEDVENVLNRATSLLNAMDYGSPQADITALAIEPTAQEVYLRSEDETATSGSSPIAGVKEIEGGDGVGIPQSPLAPSFSNRSVVDGHASVDFGGDAQFSPSENTTFVTTPVFHPNQLSPPSTPQPLALPLTPSLYPDVESVDDSAGMKTLGSLEARASMEYGDLTLDAAISLSQGFLHTSTPPSQPQPLLPTLHTQVSDVGTSAKLSRTFFGNVSSAFSLVDSNPNSNDPLRLAETGRYQSSVANLVESTSASRRVDDLTTSLSSGAVVGTTAAVVGEEPSVNPISLVTPLNSLATLTPANAQAQVASNALTPLQPGQQLAILPSWSQLGEGADWEVPELGGGNVSFSLSLSPQPSVQQQQQQPAPPPVRRRRVQPTRQPRKKTRESDLVHLRSELWQGVMNSTTMAGVSELLLQAASTKVNKTAVVTEPRLSTLIDQVVRSDIAVENTETREVQTIDMNTARALIRVRFQDLGVLQFTNLVIDAIYYYRNATIKETDRGAPFGYLPNMQAIANSNLFYDLEVHTRLGVRGLQTALFDAYSPTGVMALHARALYGTNTDHTAIFHSVNILDSLGSGQRPASRRRFGNNLKEFAENNNVNFNSNDTFVNVEQSNAMFAPGVSVDWSPFTHMFLNTFALPPDQRTGAALRARVRQLWTIVKENKSFVYFIMIGMSELTEYTDEVAGELNLNIVDIYRGNGKISVSVTTFDDLRLRHRGRRVRPRLLLHRVSGRTLRKLTPTVPQGMGGAAEEEIDTPSLPRVRFQDVDN